MTSGCGRCFRVALGLQLFGGWWWWFLTSTAATAAEWPPRRHGRHDLWRSKRSLFVLRHRAGASSEDDTHDFVTDPTLNENEPEEHRAERIDAVNDELTPLLLREDAEKVDAEDDAPHNPFRSESFPEDGRNALPSFVGKTRHTSDVMVDLSTRSGVNGQILPPESLQLRALITQRTAEYWHEVRAAAATAAVTTEPADPDPPQQQQQQPSTRPDVRKKLLHYLAPKIPAIKHSPDVALPIRCARSDMDSGVAACLIGTLGHVVVVAQQTFHDDQSTMMNDGKCSRVAEKIVSDRRFEQLVECLLCGSVDVKERQKEWWEVQQQQQQGKKSGGHDATTTTTITAEMNDRTEAIFEKNEARLEEGLSIRDSCRAALGLALLVGVDQTTEEIGGEKVSDILTALALRTRDMLLLRFQKLKQSDLDENDDRWDLSIDERLVDFAEELAEDTATAMWTFARVREKFTSLPCYQPLLDVCCSILCADPWDLRRLAQEIEVTIDATIVGSNDIVDRLAFSEEIDEKAEKQTCPDDDFIRTSETSSMAPDKRDDAVLIDFDPAEPLITRKVSIMDWLSPNELTSTLWALASHGNEKNKPGLTEIENTFRDCAFERIIEWLRLELEYARAVEIEEDVKALHVEHRKEPVSPLSTRVHENQANDCNPNIPVVNSVTLESGDIEVGVGFSTATADNRTIIMADDGVSHVRIVDASALLAHESVHDDDDWVDDAYVEDLVMSTAIESPLFNSIAEIIRPKKYFQLFSASDLCSIAWTVTELNATLREPVMAAVMKLFVYAGPESLQGLYGGNLSNLAWAVAKNANNNDQALRSHALDVLLTGWIADLVLRTAREKSLTDDLFQRFHPAQLSRLFCAIATVHSTRVDGTRMTGTGLRELGSVGLMTAASNLDLFSTEDLVSMQCTSSSRKLGWHCLTGTFFILSSSGTHTMGISCLIRPCHVRTTALFLSRSAGNGEDSNENGDKPFAMGERAVTFSTRRFHDEKNYSIFVFLSTRAIARSIFRPKCG